MNTPVHSTIDEARREALSRLSEEQWTMSIYRFAGGTKFIVIPAGSMPPCDYDAQWMEDYLYKFKE